MVDDTTPNSVLVDQNVAIWHVILLREVADIVLGYVRTLLSFDPYLLHDEPVPEGDNDSISAKACHVDNEVSAIGILLADVREQIHHGIVFNEARWVVIVFPVPFHETLALGLVANQGQLLSVLLGSVRIVLVEGLDEFHVDRECALFVRFVKYLVWPSLRRVAGQQMLCGK